MGRLNVGALLILSAVAMVSCSREPADSAGSADGRAGTRVNATDAPRSDGRVVERGGRTRVVNERPAVTSDATTAAADQTTATTPQAAADPTTAAQPVAQPPVAALPADIDPVDAAPVRVKPGEPIPSYARFRSTISGMREAAATGLAQEQKDQLLVIKDNLHFETIKVRPMTDREEGRFEEQTADLQRLYEEAANSPDAATRQAALDKINQILQQVENTLQQPQNP